MRKPNIEDAPSFVGMDQDKTRFWYSDAGGQPGTWEISSLAIPWALRR